MHVGSCQTQGQSALSLRLARSDQNLCVHSVHIMAIRLFYSSPSENAFFLGFAHLRNLIKGK